MKLSLAFFISLHLMACVVQQPSSTQGSGEAYAIRHDFIRLLDVDPLGHLYIVDRSDRLIQFDSTRQRLFTVVNNNLGRIHSLDTGNPFKIMLFYRDQQTIVLYDNTLSELQRIPLIQWGFQDVTAACLSADNAIWLFDAANSVLLKMSDQGNPILTSDPFDIINPASARPDFIYDFDQYLLLKEIGKDFSLFNDFGNNLRTLSIAGDQFTTSGDQLVVHDKLGVHLYTLPGGEIVQTFSIPEEWQGRQIYLLSGEYYIVNDKGLSRILYQ